jgi:hypothetical protein
MPALVFDRGKGAETFFFFFFPLQNTTHPSAVRYFKFSPPSRIVSLAPLHACPTLKTIIAASNEITGIDAQLFAALPRLEVLVLDDNPLEELGLPPHDHRALRDISAALCRLTGLEALVRFTGRCPSLSTVDFSANPVSGGPAVLRGVGVYRNVQIFFAPVSNLVFFFL